MRYEELVMLQESCLLSPGRDWVFKGPCGSLQGEEGLTGEPLAMGTGERHRPSQTRWRGEGGLERSESGSDGIVATLDVELEVREPSGRNGRCEGDGGSSGP